MPQISIPKDIDATYLAQIALLGNAWGHVVNEDDQTFAFETVKFEAVEQAIIDYPERYLAHRKSLRLEQLAEIRRAKELLGPNGMVLDAQTSARLNGAATGLMLSPSTLTVRWELSRGAFVTMPRETVLGLAASAFLHIQACFDTVFVKTEEVKAIVLNEETTLADALLALEAIDLTTGWPVA